MGRILSAARPDSGRDAMIRRIAIAVVVLVFLGLLGFSSLSWRAAIAPIERPNPASFSAESVAKGEVLAAEGHCVSCHIRPGGQPFAGGYGANTPFGIIYGSNITPDPKTGIGGRSLEAFTRAMREGVSRDGSHLFAAFPFNAYTELQEDDVKALYAYLMTRTGVDPLHGAAAATMTPIIRDGLALPVFCAAAIFL
jgi:mono/diheme cytochrome c family protein